MKLKNYLHDIIRVAEDMGIHVSDLTRDDYRQEGMHSTRVMYNFMSNEGFEDPGFGTAKRLAIKLLEEGITENDMYDVEVDSRPQPKKVAIWTQEKSAEAINYITSLSKIKPTKPYTPSENKGRSSCLLVSDIHMGKAVHDEETGEVIYNKEKAISRFEDVTVKFIGFCHQNAMLDEIVLCLNGDNQDGDGIYLTQAYHLDMPIVPQQVDCTTRLIWDLILRVRQEFPGIPIRIEGDMGNHGRVRKDAHPKTNWDLMGLYILKILNDFSDVKNVQVNFSGGKYRNFTIKGHKFHMRHHIDTAQTETPSARAKLGGWEYMHDYDVAICAHLHNPVVMRYMDKPVLRNGSIVGLDDLSETIAKGCFPCQTYFEVDEDNEVMNWNVLKAKF